MTETSATISTWKCEEDPETEGCVGRPFTNVEVRVVDDDRTTLGPYQVGEIVTKGPNVTSGYWRAEEETKAALRDGWLYTGDLGYLDEEGRIYLVGRKKELINTGGEKVVPGEVERVLSMHPSVADVAVIGVDDPLWGERVHAIVVKKQEVTERELIEFCEGRLAGYKKPKSIEFVDVIPRSPAGKIMRHLLKKQRTVSHRG
jgi:acyl-CoA synthetase (AMP-forming)/AMP-acid ligase II